VRYNPQKGEFPIEIGGRVRKLNFTFESIAKMQDVLQSDAVKGAEIGITEVIELKPSDMNNIPLLLWGGLVGDDPILTIKKVKGWGLVNLSSIVTQLNQAWIIALMGDENPTEPPVESDHPEAKSGTGATSES